MTKKIFHSGLLLVSISAMLYALWHVFSINTFETWLLLATSTSGFYYALSGLKTIAGNSKKKKTDLSPNQSGMPSDSNRLPSPKRTWITGWNEFWVSIFPVLVIVFILRSFLFEPFRIPSGSMLPTLHLGDFILVNKYAYGMRLPISGTPIFPQENSDVQRGDVVVFRFPNDPTIDYIKRVIGLPGEHILIEGNQVFVNGVLLKKKYLGIYQGKQKQYIGGTADYFLEQGKVNDRYVLWHPYAFSSTSKEYTVPEEHYFVLGDNRSNSSDSRVWGFVPDQNLKGQAIYIWFNWFDHIDWQRVGTNLLSPPTQDEKN